MTLSPATGSACLENGTQSNIVIVEDNQDVLSLLKDFFESAGHNVKTYLDSQLALDTLQSDGSLGFAGEPHIVICDLTMPNVTGLQLTVAVRNLNHTIPVILMTAYGDRIANEQSKEAGAYAFLPKPFSLSKIKSLVDEAYSAIGFKLEF